MTPIEAPTRPPETADAILSAEEHLARIKHQEAFVQKCRDALEEAKTRRKDAKAALDRAETELHRQINAPEGDLPFETPQE